jgi:hypothetical protein
MAEIVGNADGRKADEWRERLAEQERSGLAADQSMTAPGAATEYPRALQTVHLTLKWILLARKYLLKGSLVGFERIVGYSSRAPLRAAHQKQRKSSA